LPINLQDLPLALADFLNTTEFAGGLILFTIVFLTIEIPLIYMTKGKGNEKQSFIPETIGGVVALGLGVAFGWLNIFFLLLLCFLIAVLIARLWGN
jgi:hypothetical protein